MTSTQLDMPQGIRNLMASMWGNIQRMDRERIEAEAKKDPKAYRDTNVMTNTRFRYWSVPDLPKGKRIAFCYSTHPNVAGYFLTWTEVWDGPNGYRTLFHGWAKKRDAREYCQMRYTDAKKPKPERKFILPPYKKAA